MKVKCISVRLKEMKRVSSKAYMAVAFDGSSCFIPASQVIARDFTVEKCEAWWITEWILQQKGIQYSTKKSAWFDKDTGVQMPSISVFRHFPEHKEALPNNLIDSLHYDPA